MITRAAAAAAVLALACGGPTTRSASPTGCPPAGLVALAEWNPRTVGGSPDYEGTPEDATWLVRLGFVAGDADGDGEDDDELPAAGAVPSYEIAKRGLGPLPDQVWLLRPGVAPCAARIDGYVAEYVNDGLLSVRLSAVLRGCQPADPDAPPPAWISFAGAEPSECRLVVPERTAGRTGEDGDGGFTVAPLTDDNALPAVWAAAAPPEPCEGCETLWAVDSIAGEPALDAVLVTSMSLEETCMGEVQDSYGIYATAAGGAPVRLAIEGQYRLAGALADKTGTRVVLLDGLARWEAHDVRPDGTVGPGRAVDYYLPHDEDTLHVSLAPYCGP